MSSPTPRDIAERLVHLTATGPDPALADLFAEDAVLDFPFRSPGAPDHPQGREGFRAHLAGAVGVQRFDGADDVRIRLTDEPGTVLLEYLLRGTVLSTGRTFALRTISVFEVRDGLITRLRSYSNPLDAVVAFGGVPQLVEALAAA